MSANQQQTQVTLDQLTFTFEDIAKIDAILGALPYRTVKPIYIIIEERMRQQGEAKLADINTPKEPEEKIESQRVPIIRVEEDETPRRLE